MNRWLQLWVVVLASIGSANAACLLQLDLGISCGDGYIDQAAGEVCDPRVTESFEGRCDGTARPLGNDSDCDPELCIVRTGPEQCGVCGDGVVDPEIGEECEEGVPIDAECEGPGFVSCTLCQLDRTTCDECGNGTREPSEDCDFDLNGITVEDTCEGVRVPGLPELRYTYGRLRCEPDCTWDYTGCGLCGNGELDEFPIVDPSTGLPLRPPEVCDGNRFNIDALQTECSAICQTPLTGLSCDVRCDVGCLGMTLVDADDPKCCLLPGAPRSDSGPPCCCTLANPDDPSACGEEEAPSPDGNPTCPFPIG